MRHYQGCTNSSWCDIYGRMCAIMVAACLAYVMWAESDYEATLANVSLLVHCKFLLCVNV